MQHTDTPLTSQDNLESSNHSILQSVFMQRHFYTKYSTWSNYDYSFLIWREKIFCVIANHRCIGGKDSAFILTSKIQMYLFFILSP